MDTLDHPNELQFHVTWVNGSRGSRPDQPADRLRKINEVARLDGHRGVKEDFMAVTLRSRPRTNGRVARKLVARVLPRADRLEVWLFDRATPLRRIASLNIRLLDDARHHGQDLLDEALGAVLREIEIIHGRALSRGGSI